MSSAVVTDQFGSFDGLDNRKSILDLFKRLGARLPEAEAACARAGFLTGLARSSVTCFAMLPVVVPPCSAVEAYHWFVAITGVLGVPVEKGTRILEEVVRRLG